MRFILFVMLLSGVVFAQMDFVPRLSPNATVNQKVGITDVTVTYCRPAVRDRQIWGDLVAYDKIWRTGANEATTIEFSSAVKVNGSEIPAGKYALFTIPNPDEWTVILNKNAEQWGKYNYDQKEDLLRLKVKPETNTNTHENLEFYFVNREKNKSDLVMSWEKVNIKLILESHTTDLSDKKVRVSPASMVHQRVGVSDIKISYASPAVKGRKIWGELVPFDKVWRTGANEATTVSFSTNVKLNGNDVPAGTYSLFTIPEQDSWTVILNKKAGQWGAYDYDPGQDALRFEVQPQQSDFSERMKFSFSELNTGNALVSLHWENLELPIKIETDIMNLTYQNIQNAFADEKMKDNPRVYSLAAGFAADHKVFLDEAIKWTQKAIELKDHFYYYFIMARIYAAQDDAKMAREYVDKCRNKGKDNPDFKGFEQTLAQFEQSI